jgi:hypothetical protein
MSRWILTHDRLIFLLVYRKIGWKGRMDGYGHYIYFFSGMGWNG